MLSICAGVTPRRAAVSRSIDQIGLQTPLFLIGADIGHDRVMLESLDQALGPMKQLVGVVGP